VNKRKILVFAHVPPPHHGQSVMVQILLEGLRADPRFEVHHVDARVSDDMGDIGSFRPQKFLRLFKCIAQAWWIRLRFGRMAFYYVPAPAKRSAIMRDWVVMALCRPVFPELILHWHAYGLGEWVAAGIDGQRKLTRWVLGRADLSIVLNNYNKRDAAVFAPKRIEVVPNGIADQFPDYETALAPKRQARADQLGKLAAQPKASENKHMDILQNVHVTAGGGGGALEVVRFLFLGHLIESKGVFVAIEATKMANQELRRKNAGWRAHLTLAGSFASEEEKARVLVAIKTANKVTGDENRNEVEIAPQPRSNLITSGEEPSSAGRLRVGEQGGAMIELVGFLDSVQKKSALERADCLVFPTFYENEAQPLVLLEAMSAGLSVITTSWRGVPEVLPEGYPGVVAPRSAGELAAAVLQRPVVSGNQDLRRLYEERYTIPSHVESMAEVLESTKRKAQ
jgi:glycosyltransferase involved in cell wall biosynthesis